MPAATPHGSKQRAGRWARRAVLPLLPLVACATSSPPAAAPDDEQRVAAVLDDFHDAAARADETRYFQHFAPEGVFLGTDATERWTVDAFRSYAHPHFSAGKGWTYRPTKRHLSFTPDGQHVYFDELLSHARYGTLRGSGVLRRVADGSWKICQYNLSFMVPNPRAMDVVRCIQSSTSCGGSKEAG